MSLSHIIKRNNFNLTAERNGSYYEFLFKGFMRDFGFRVKDLNDANEATQYLVSRLSNERGSNRPSNETLLDMISATNQLVSELQ